MRSYKQRCGLAKALDLVGDRWTLLIVRELLIRGPCRYTDLQTGLPGIATNLLADRLREMEAERILVREEAPPPIATSLFQLTARGRDLEPALLQLGLWGAPLLAAAAKGDAFQPHWLVLPLRALLADRKPEDRDINMELRVGGEQICICAAGGEISVRLGAAYRPDAVVTGRAEKILQLFAARVTLSAARLAGVQWEGAADLLYRVAPRPEVTSK
jgi:DNA-binding HxlR family transcriptional regulator